METPVSLNKVVLLGAIGPRGVEMAYGASGAPYAVFVLQLDDLGTDGKLYRTYAPCEIHGRHSEEAVALAPGQLCLIDGRLRWRRGQDGDKGSLIVHAWQAVPIGVPSAAQQPLFYGQEGGGYGR
jgi:hypothetical protein